MIQSPLESGSIKHTPFQYNKKCKVEVSFATDSDGYCCKYISSPIIAKLSRASIISYGGSIGTDKISIKLYDEINCDYFNGLLSDLDVETTFDKVIRSDIDGLNSFPIFLCGQFKIYIECSVSCYGILNIYLEEITNELYV